MPSPKDPLAPEYYVYGLEALGTIFYVGIGRSIRASDRVRYVRYLIKRQQSGKRVNWVLSNEAIAGVLNRGVDIRVWYLHVGLPRERALALERKAIKDLSATGIVLANLQHNDGCPESAEDVVKSVLSRHAKGVTSI